jgi:3'-phosphoadenosine 5'-phosphosulfate (PAPS) 3'-phosphatase
MVFWSWASKTYWSACIKAALLIEKAAKIYARCSGEEIAAAAHDLLVKRVTLRCARMR